jgi:small-conductance mechanosensitive channel
MDLSQLAAEFQRALDVALAWAGSPQFYAQAGIVAVAIIIAWAVAGFIRSRVAPHDGRADDSPLRRQLHQARVLIFPLLLILVLRMASDFSRMSLGQSGLVRTAQGIAVVFLLYTLISRFVANNLLRSVFKWIVIPVAILHVIGWLDDVTTYLDSINFEVGKLRISAFGVIRFIVFGSILFWLGRISNIAGQQIIRRQEELDIGAREVAAKLFQITIFVIIAVVLLQLMAIDLTALAVFGGAVGIGIGFGLQAIASNFISGLIILLDRSVTVGDYVELEDGVSGVIREMNMRSTLLETFDGKDIMVPNSMFISERFANWTHKHRKQRYAFTFQVAYDTDIPAAIEIVRKVVRSHPQVLEGPDLPIEERADAEIQKFADSGIEILVEFWMEGIDDGKNRVGADLLMMIWEAFRENGIRFPFPQREVRLLEAPK